MGNYSKFHENPQSLCNVVAFDPGETTGFCVMGIPPDDLLWPRNMKLSDLLHDHGHIEYGQIDCRTGSSNLQDYETTVFGHAGIGLIAEHIGASDMIDLAREFKGPIVLEDFVIDMRKIDQARHTLSPVRMISMFSYGLGIAELNRVHIQNRSLHKTTCTDDRLREWGLYDLHSGPHARDATRIAYYFLRQCMEGRSKGAAEKRWRGWPNRFDDPVDRTKKPRAKKVGTRIESIR